MQLSSFPFQTVNWSTIPVQGKKGESGIAYWQIFMVNDIRVRKVEYSPGYNADHWCSKGHLILCLEGEMDTELDDGRILKLTAGMTYFVGDNCEAHRTSTPIGCKLFIVIKQKNTLAAKLILQNPLSSLKFICRNFITFIDTSSQKHEEIAAAGINGLTLF